MMSTVLTFMLVAVAVFGSLHPTFARKTLSKFTKQRSSAIIFPDTQSSQPRQPPTTTRKPNHGVIEFGGKSAIERQEPDGSRHQNVGDAAALLDLEQIGYGGNSQSANTSAVVQTLQTSNSLGLGSGGTHQQSENQVHINLSQHQQNVHGTLINIGNNHTGVVIINSEQDQVVSDSSARVYSEIIKALINKRPLVSGEGVSRPCRYTCLRPNHQVYCCDDGSDKEKNRKKYNINGGYCPQVRPVCLRNSVVSKCAHDAQCDSSERCCYDVCVEHHICKLADAEPHQ